MDWTCWHRVRRILGCGAGSWRAVLRGVWDGRVFERRIYVMYGLYGWKGQDLELELCKIVA